MKHFDERKGQSYRMMYSLNQKTEMEINRRCGTETARALNEGMTESARDGRRRRGRQKIQQETIVLGRHRKW